MRSLNSGSIDEKDAIDIESTLLLIFKTLIYCLFISKTFDLINHRNELEDFVNLELFFHLVCTITKCFKQYLKNQKSSYRFCTEHNWMLRLRLCVLLSNDLDYCVCIIKEFLFKLYLFFFFDTIDPLSTVEWYLLSISIHKLLSLLQIILIGMVDYKLL